MPTTKTKAEDALIAANAIVAQFVPLVGIIGVGVRATIALLKRDDPATAASFETEMALFDAQRVQLGAAIDAFKAKYPKP